jgi:hypothetical protein
MRLYPEGYAPFISRGLCLDPMTADGIQEIANERSLERCLNPAMWRLGDSRLYLELLRGCLFRAEQLIDTQPLPARDYFILLPHDMPALLETLKSAQRCLEEWLESQTCQRILQQYPRRPRTEPISPGTTK